MLTPDVRRAISTCLAEIGLADAYVVQTPLSTDVGAPDRVRLPGLATLVGDALRAMAYLALRGAGLTKT